MMSSMQKNSLVTPLLASALLSASTLSLSSPLASQDTTAWDQARIELVASQPSQISEVVKQWEYLQSREDLRFSDYAGFLLAYPGFPQEQRLRNRAEKALDRESQAPASLVAYFDAFPPLSNAARARYALALHALGRSEAREIARAAWRAGQMSGPSESYLQLTFGSVLTDEDHLERVNALLWQEDLAAAQRIMAQLVGRASPTQLELLNSRLALISPDIQSSTTFRTDPQALSDPGYLFNLVRHFRKSGQMAQAVMVLTQRPKFNALPFDTEAMLAEMLAVAMSALARDSVKIAASARDIFPQGADISKLSYRLRDDYTSLVWLGGVRALWDLGDAKSASPLFFEYGAAARTGPTRSKGFYWAGHASAQTGDASSASQFWKMAAAYPDRFYGMLALEKLGQPMPDLSQKAVITISPQVRAAFEADPLVRAVEHIAQGAPWRTAIQFFRTLADKAETPEEHLLVAELAHRIGRRDLAVNLADSAQADGQPGFVVIGFPIIEVPAMADWTMVHAIARQESQFAHNAISHAGARGLMQLMPGTAREQAGKLGMNYLSASLIDDQTYNILLGNGYFTRMMDYYGGSYPLAIAAYNAGPGNVNKWLRANGDPRTGDVGWLEWIERIPIYETKNYVQRVIENAVVYEHLYPEKAERNRPRNVSSFLR